MLMEIIVVSAIIALGGFTQGLTGFGLALVSVPSSLHGRRRQGSRANRRYLWLAGNLPAGLENATACEMEKRADPVHSVPFQALFSGRICSSDCLARPF